MGEDVVCKVKKFIEKLFLIWEVICGYYLLIKIFVKGFGCKLIFEI